MAGCKQVFCWRTWPAGTNSTSYRGFEAATAWLTASGRDQPWLVTGDFRNFIVDLDTAPGAGTSITYTLMINGVDSALTFTISGTNTNGSVAGPVYVTSGDLILIKRSVTGSPTLGVQRASLEFNGANAGESGYGHSAQASSARNTLFNPDQLNTTTGITRYSLAAAPGNVTALAANMTAAPGVGNSRTVVIYLNDVKQDGAGGTVDTRCTVSDTATQATVTFSLPVSAGDRLYTEWSSVGTPASANTAMGCRFTATTDGYSQVCFGDPAGLNDSNTRYTYPLSANVNNWNATETNVDAKAGTSSFVLRDLRQRWSNTSSVTITLRQNAGATALTCATAASTTASDTTHTVTINSGDLWDFERAGTTGFSRTGWFGCVMQASSSYTPPSTGRAPKLVSWGWN